jgi:Tfp pilus assembly protein PilN
MRQVSTLFGSVLRWPFRLTGTAGREVFRLNLSSQARQYLGPARMALAALSVVLIVALLWEAAHIVLVTWEAREIQAALARVQAQDKQVVDEARAKGVDLSDQMMLQLPNEVALANQIIEKRSFSWTRFLSELEQAIPSHVAISSIRLDPGSLVIHLTGTAVGLEDVTTFTVALQDHPTFKNPVLGQHRDAGNGMVEFDLTLHYRLPKPQDG